MTETPIRDRIDAKLREAFAPIFLKITDDSARHAGHAGHNPAGESHFTIMLVSDSFKELSPTARHRLVYQTLSDEMTGRIHALSLKTMTPDEVAGDSNFRL